MNIKYLRHTPPQQQQQLQPLPLQPQLQDPRTRQLLRQLEVRELELLCTSVTTSVLYFVK